MKETIIKNLQKLFNKGFFYNELIDFVNKQEELIYSKIDYLEETEFNSLLSFLYNCLNHFKSFNKEGFLITTTISANSAYIYYNKTKVFVKKYKWWLHPEIYNSAESYLTKFNEEYYLL